MHDETLRYLDGPLIEAPGSGSAPSAESAHVAVPSAPSARDASPRRRPRWPGVLAVVIAAGTGALVAVGISLATDGALAGATAIAWTAVAVSVAGVVLGLIAVISGLGRVPGAIGAVLCVLANPLILTALLGAAAGLA